MLAVRNFGAANPQLVYADKSITAAARGRNAISIGNSALKAAVRLWFLVAAIGQSLLVLHIVSFYGRSAMTADWAHWNTFLSRGIVPGDQIGNFALAMHLSVAAVITTGGPLQLIPQIRTRWPIFHRWTGRVYLLTAVLGSLSALYLLWIRKAGTGGVVQRFGITFDACLIIICAAMALRYALAHKFDVHRRWAIRLFLVVSGNRRMAQRRCTSNLC